MNRHPRVVVMPRGTRVYLEPLPLSTSSTSPAKNSGAKATLRERMRRALLAPNLARVRSASGALGLLVALMTTPASAQFFVYDPANYSQNILTAARSLEQIQNQITSLQNEAQMLINQAKNLTNLPTSLLSDIEQSFSGIQDLLHQADGIAYDVQNIETQFQQNYTGFAANKSDQELVESARGRWQSSVDAFEHALKVGAGAVENIEQTEHQTSSLVDASQSAIGVLQATQAGNQLLAVQAGQMTNLIALLAAQGRADALEQARQAAEHEQAEEQFRRFMEGTPYQPETVRMFGG